MLKEKAISLFKRNWRAKLLSVVTAAIAWFFISLNQSSIVSYPNKISVNFEGIKENLVAVAANDNVQVKINVDAVNLKDLEDSDFKATVDLTGLENGVYEKEINVITTSPEVQIVSWTPRKTTIKIDTEETKNVPVRVKYEGTAADGYIVSDATPEPQEVKVVGPKTTIDTITEAVAPIKINGEKEGFEKISNLFVYDAQGDEIKFIKIDPVTAKTKISITPAGETKTVGIKTKTKGSVKNGYWINSISTEPQTVTISGSRTKLAQTQYVETEAIDISDLSEDKSYTTQLNVDSGIKVEDKYSSIKISVDIEKMTTTKTVDVSVKFKNTPSGLSAKPDPDKVSVEVLTDKAALSESDVTLTIDLSSYTKGVHDITISNNMFSLADDISLEKILTTTIKVTVE